MKEQDVGTSLSKALETISRECVECGLCTKECRFLREYGNPKRIAEGFDIFKVKHQVMAYACNLCHLCTAVCPKGQTSDLLPPNSGKNIILRFQPGSRARTLTSE